jgi:YD repeat-containing protein
MTFRTLVVAASLAALSRTAAAQSIAVNSTSPPATVTVAAGATVSITIANGPGNVQDWVGVYTAGTSDYSYLNWRYLNGTQTAPSTGLSNTTFSFPLPSSAGDYDFRFFSNGSWTRLAVSGVVTALPAPTITSITPSSAAVGDVVTIAGANYRATQGSSTITFHGTSATPAYWSNGTITVRVPSGATTGSVVVTVLGAASSGTSFTVTTISPGTISGTITRATGGSAVSGATIEARQAGVLKSGATSAANGTYTISSLEPATYDVRVLASGFSNEFRSTVVSSNATSTVNVALSQPGSVSGTITQSNGATPIAGAAVTLYVGPAIKGVTSTNGSGAYSIASLAPGAYTVQAASVGFRTKQQSATITENTNTTSNLSLDSATAGTVSYVYDELDRLVSVIDPSGDAANYTYDAVGNLLAIARAGTTTVSISEVTPNGGAVGAAVTIYGTGFSSTPSSNTVTFNGTAAAISTASTTQLVTSVPTGATSGSIVVTSPNGSATSGTSFVVTTATAGAPTITNLSPQTWDGSSALTITGTNFDTTAANDRVNLNVAFAAPTTAAATSLAVPVPGTATSGHVTVATIAGTATSSSDFFIPPPGYAASNVQSTGRMTLGGNQTVSITTAGKFAMRVFDGVPGHRVSVMFTGVTIGTGTATLYDPYGRQLGTTGLGSLYPRFIDAVAMLSPATYTLVVSASASSTGDATINLYELSDIGGTIVPGGSSVTVTTTVPGQNGRVTFSGTAGQRVSLGQSGFNCLSSTTTVKNPDGSPLASTCGGYFLDVQTLATTGTYTILVDPKDGGTGATTLTLYDVPADVTGTITPGGAAVTVTTTVPGQNGRLTFSGTAGQRISLGQSGYNCFTATTTIQKPDGSTLASTCGGAFIDVQTLPTTGTYTILVDPIDVSTGSTTLTLYSVPSDTTATATVGGSAVAVTLSTPGQNGTVTFSGTSSQQITVHVTGNTIGSVAITLLGTDGVTVLASSTSSASAFDLSTVTLSATGTYTVKVDPAGLNTGTLNIGVTNP